MSTAVFSVTSVILLLLASPVAGTSKATNSPLHTANLPLAFEPNRGQAEHGVDYVARGNGYSVSLKPSEAVIALHQRTGNEVDVLHVGFSGSRRDTTALGTAQLTGHSNYIRGRNPEGWIQDVPQFARVQYRAIYPGIDLVYYGNHGQLEYDFLVNPNADAKRIAMRFDGAKNLSIDETGNLVVQLAGGNLVQKQPLAYQTVHGKPVEVKVRYGILKNNVVEFSIGAYDKSRPLIIDPMLIYSTYLGGSGLDGAATIAVDAEGNAYVAGGTSSTDFPAINAAQPHRADPPGNPFGFDAFVAKINKDGSAILFSTFLGGSADDFAYGAAVDFSGNVYVTGVTQSTDFPVLNAYQDHFSSSGPGSNNAFVTKLTSTGALAYSTYLSFGFANRGAAIAVDVLNNAYIALNTTIIESHPPSVFVAKLNDSGNNLLYKLQLGVVRETANDIKVDLLGHAFVSGSTYDPDFPTTPGAFKAPKFPDADAFVSKISSDGNTLLWSTLLGGSEVEASANLAIDAAGSVYLTGQTLSTDFPIRGAAFQTTKTVIGVYPHYNGFLSIFTGTGDLAYSSYFGGTGEDAPHAIALDAFGNIYIAGETSSSDFPTVNAVQPTMGSTNSPDGFVLKFNKTATGLLYSTYLGGNAMDEVDGLAVLPSGAIYVTGFTASSNFPVKNAIQPDLSGSGDAFIAKISDGASSEGENILVSLRTGHIQEYSSTGLLARDIVDGDDGAAKGMAFDSAGNLFVAHWVGSTSATGNNVELFDANLAFQNTFAGNLNCNPTSVVFDSAGNLFVGEADCNGNVLKFSPSGTLLATFHPAPENHGAEWIDLASDNCTLLYGSEGPHVKRFNVCTGTQLPNLNSTPVSGVFQVKILPDTTVLAATFDRIERFNAAGNIIQEYVVPGETCFRGVALDPTGTAFFATNYCNSHVYKFDLATGIVLMSFTAASPGFTVKSVAVQKSNAQKTGSTCLFNGGGTLPGWTGPDLMTSTNVTYGFDLHCNTAALPNNLELNFDSGNHFLLENLLGVTCTMSPAIPAGNPAAACNVITGIGNGSLNGVSGATIEFLFTDASEPGTSDAAIIRILDANGNQVLNSYATLTSGNNQAHGQ